MKKAVIFAVALSLTLIGCARGRLGDGLNGYTDWLVQSPNPLLPNVFVVKASGEKERLIIDQEPIALRGLDFPVTIRWALRAGSEYQFPDKKALSSLRRDCAAAAPDLADRLNCSIEGKDGKTLGCSFDYRFFERGVKYCYTLTVKNMNTSGTVTSDPSMVGD